MMTRRKLLIALGAGALAAPLASFAQQQPAKIARIGFLSALSRSDTDRGDGFRQGMREIGYVEGKDFIIEGRFAEGKFERLPSLAEELVRLKVDVIVAWATPAVTAAKQATSTLPIVMVSVGEPVQSGFVASLARPGGNITGMSAVTSDLSGKLVELLIEVVPRINHVAALRNPANLSSAHQLKETETAARSLGLQLQVHEVRTPEDFESAFASMTKARAMGVVVLPDPMFISQRARIADLATKSRLPTVFGRRENAEAGGLISYGSSLSDQFRRSATYVDKILKGAKPGDLPVEQPTKFELVINMKTAKALGIKIPNSILVRADKVID